MLDDAYCEKCKDEAVPGVSVIATTQPEAIQFIIKDFCIAFCSCLAVAMMDNRSPVLHNDEKPVNGLFTKSVIVKYGIILILHKFTENGHFGDFLSRHSKKTLFLRIIRCIKI
jgi:hypothetical protein